jgi:poly(A) polymerase
MSKAAGLPGWADRPLVWQIFRLADQAGGEARLVGGAVRDWLAGHLDGGGQPDLDMASTLPPQLMAAAAAKAGLAVYETGLAHGTITLKDQQDSIELTQTRRDTRTDGRHAEVQPTDNWAEDAARRDFTVNAIYLKRDGQLFDPCGGQADLAAGRLRFIGAAEHRLAEDYLRLLRGFRLAAEKGLRLDATGLAAMREALPGLAGLSAERITAEMRRWLEAADGLVMLAEAASIGLDRALFGQAWHLPEAAFYDRLDWLGRLVLICGPDGALEECGRLRFSRAELGRVHQLGRQLDKTELAGLARPDWQQTAYWLEEAGARLLISCLWQDVPLPDMARLRQIETFKRPAFPLVGADLLAAGLAEGPQLGRRLKELEQDWVASGFAGTRAELLEQVKNA